MKTNEPIMEGAVRYYIWVGNNTDFLMSSEPVCPLKKPKHRLKYMGFTYSLGWPKRMNTGRILHENRKWKMKRIKNGKPKVKINLNKAALNPKN